MAYDSDIVYSLATSGSGTLEFILIQLNFATNKLKIALHPK